MSGITTEERLNDIAKKSKNILYSTKVFEKNEEKQEKPKIILRDLIKRNEEEESHVWAIILKYKILDNIPQEVIMGTVKLDNNLDTKESTINIINLIISQLEENVAGESGYNSFEKLYQFVLDKNIPLQLTLEGIDILANKNKETTKITRTCFENKKSKIENIFVEDDLKKIKKARTNELLEYMNKKKELKKWEDRREKILNSLEKSGKKQDFLKGEKITKFINETDKDLYAQKDIVADYFLDVLAEEKDEKNPMFNLAKEYVKLKEKGIAIDTNIQLEEIENKYYNILEKKNKEVSLNEYKNIEIIEDYEKFFDLVKKGRDWNARCFALKLKKIDFGLLKNLVKAFKSEDTELLRYLDLKEKVVNELQTDSIDVGYGENISTKEIYDFLLHSSIRKNIENDDKRIFSEIYNGYIRKEIIERNLNELSLYNHYAEKSNRIVCEIPKESNISKKEPISTVSSFCKKLCKKLELESLESEKDSKEVIVPEEDGINSGMER